MEIFMKRLKELRKEREGLTQRKFAQILNVDKSTYDRYENRNAEPSYEVLVKIADYFNVTTDYLLGRTEI